MIECALAEMLSFNLISSGEIMLYSRAIQDTIDFMLMRSRAEAELASLNTAVERLDEYTAMLDVARRRNQIECQISSTYSIYIDNISYKRGSASVRVLNIEYSLKENLPFKFTIPPIGICEQY